MRTPAPRLDRAEPPRATPAEALARREAALHEEEPPLPDALQEAAEAAAKVDEPEPAALASLPLALVVGKPGSVEGIQVFAASTRGSLMTDPPGQRPITGTVTNAILTWEDPLWYEWTRPCPSHKDPHWVQWITANGTTTALSGQRYLVTDRVWLNWNTATCTGNIQTYRADPAAVAALGAEQQRAQAAQARQRAADQLVQDQYRAQAARRARKLLTQYLTGEQRRQLAKHQFFDLVAPSGRIYRIMPGTHGNVREMVRLPDGTLRAVASLCCQPGGVPDADAHLTQLLWLKSDEEAFRKIANIRRYDPNPGLTPGRRRDLQDGAAAP